RCAAAVGELLAEPRHPRAAPAPQELRPLAGVQGPKELRELLLGRAAGAEELLPPVRGGFGPGLQPLEEQFRETDLRRAGLAVGRLRAAELSSEAPVAVRSARGGTICQASGRLPPVRDPSAR